MNNYDFNLSPYSLRQESTINSILESRLVPRDLSGLDDYKGDDEKSSIYVDSNGDSSKLKLSDITSRLIEVVNKLPINVVNGQLILYKDGQGWSLYQGVDGEWIKYEFKSEANLINVDLDSYKSKNVSDALEEVFDQVVEIRNNTVKSVKGLSGDIDILTDRHLVISEEENNLVITAPEMATESELNNQKEFLKSYTNNAELSCKTYTDLSIQSTRDDLEDMIYSPITTIEVLPEDWGGSAFPYSISKDITGVNINRRSHPSFDLNLSQAVSAEEVEAAQLAWSKVFYKSVGSNKLVLRATEKPSIKLVINIRGF